MTFDAERVIALAASDGIELPRIIRGNEQIGTCPRCGFDSLVITPVSYLYESGVTPAGFDSGCDRCATESERNTDAR